MKSINIKNLLAAGIACCLTSTLLAQVPAKNDYSDKARETLANIEIRYAVPDGKQLLRENYPFDDNYTASYLAGNEGKAKTNPYSYLWPFSGSLSAYVALLEQADDEANVKSHIDSVVLPGLENYYDTRQPAGYASYINSAAPSDRFYDDNVWLGIDFTDLYLHTKEKHYLEKAQEIWRFVASGMDDKLGGGIYWCEQKKESKNTCSNAPAVVYLLKLYDATKSQDYLDQAITLYQWTKDNLQDPEDNVYWDNINLEGKVQTAKYPYNTGQMIQAGALLYKITRKKEYLNDAQASAKGGMARFFTKEDSDSYPVLNRSDNWFIAVMLRGYVELYHQDNDVQYINAFKANMDHAWDEMRDKDGLFSKDWKETSRKTDKKWLLDQFAIAEMYARLSDFDR
ncbi:MULTISPECIES: glycoside hydrolase family 76 protein [Sphingobacterium]|uniref:Glycoside hydrolase family 76 protein n=1 Tax=Sphingobacterium populi TaxID=1812824 RepID=A0ABW5UBD4_9SPHI|nr:glycoside hydrolase family 76 protein [Sphingobacterium sp. CFCC 11742]